MIKVSFHHTRQAARFRQGAAAGLGLALLFLAGCSDKESTSTPLDWWHNLEGGVIATQRPPPPGENEPYPIIGTLPPRPPAADVAAQQAISDSLAAQRDSALRAAQADPLKPLPPAPAPPKPAAPNPNANKVVVDAAAAPPPAATPSAAPPPAARADTALPGIDTVPAVPDAAASGPLPDLAAAPPPPPAGFDLPTGTPTAAPPAAVPKPPPAPANSVAIAFTPQSSTLPPSAALRLQQFVVAHKGAPLLVTGRGDGLLRNADAQARALDLGLKRAQAMATFLAQAGVAAANLHLRADAAGTGGIVSLN